MRPKIIEIAEGKYASSWIVYYTLNNGMSYPGRLYIKKSEACDELAAYVQAMRILEQTHDY